jgi:hypothetical protein
VKHTAATEQSWFWLVPDGQRPGSTRLAAPWPLTEADAAALNSDAERVTNSQNLREVLANASDRPLLSAGSFNGYRP